MIVRLLGGDETLVAEIHKNAQVQATLSSDHPAAIFREEVDRKRALHDLEKDADALKRTRLETLDMAGKLVAFYSPGQVLSHPNRLLIADAAMNIIAGGSSRMLVEAGGVVSGGPALGARHQIPASDLFRQVTGRAGDKNDWNRVGRYLVKEFRTRHGGAEPSKVERMIDGTTRMVNAYSSIEDPWIVEFVRGMERD
jgi:hypothetical protein